MKAMKKLMGILLAWCLITGMAGNVSAVVSAAPAEDGRLQIAKFDNLTAIQSLAGSKSYISPSVEQTWDDAAMSLKWKIVKDSNGDVAGISGAIKASATDWSQYQWFRMRLYATGVGDQFNIIPNQLGKDNVADNPYFSKKVTIVKPGWQEIAVPLITNGGGFASNPKTLPGGDAATSPTWSNIAGLYLDIGGWGAVATEGNVIYIDEIWLEKDTQAYSANTDGIQGEDQVVLDVTAPGTISATPSAVDYPVSIHTREGGNGIYSMIDVSARKDTTFALYQNTTPVDISSYRYLNLWIYSPKAVNGGLQAVIYSDGSNIYALKSLGALDWQGWKLVTLEIQDASGDSVYDSVKEGFDPAKMVGFRLNANGWANSDVTKGYYTPIWYEPGSFGVEKIWFSQTPPTDSSETAPPSSAPSTALPEGNLVIKEYNHTGAMNDTEGKPLKNLTATTRNNHLYQMTAQSAKWNTGSCDVDLYKGAGEQGGTGDAVKDSKISATTIQGGEYEYLNAWIYNPGIKTNGDNISQLNWVVVTGTALDNSAWTNGYFMDRVTMDWTGWKLVSMPITDRAKNNGIWRIYLNANGWSPATTPWVDLGNYINVDRVWLSKELPQALQITERSVDENATEVPLNLNGEGALTYTFNNVLQDDAGEHLTIYRDYTRLTAESDYCISLSQDNKTLTIQFAGDLTSGTSYRIKFDQNFRDVYGSSLSQQGVVYTFATENPPYRITDTSLIRDENGAAVASATVQVYDGNPHDFTVIVYEKDGDVLLNLETASLSNVTKEAGSRKITTLPLKLTGSSGNDVRMLIWDNHASMQPYMAPIPYQEAAQQ